MEKQKRAEDYGINIGKLKSGILNKITDVKGIKVGHCTIDTDELKTGVTVIIPSDKDIYRNKLMAASYALNGYGKTTGLMQINEIGSIETPIVLTNTLNVGLVHDAVVEFMIQEGKKNGIDISSVNPIVAECNDSYLSNIQLRAVKKEHVFEAIHNAKEDFEEGSIGAGKGTSCHQLKGGIGSASRTVIFDNQTFTVGVLVQSNYGVLEDLTICGKPIGMEINQKFKNGYTVERGSIISVIATDIPLDSRQLRRVCKRAGNGLARLGSITSHYSGEVMIAFSTANVLDEQNPEDILNIRVLKDEKLDSVFRAVAECEEEAVINSMVTSETVKGFGGNFRDSLKYYIQDI